jgi:hypothetical protein
MSDSVNSGDRRSVSTTAATVAVPGLGGIIDVGGTTFDQLSAMIGREDLGRALDYILASGHNGSGYHGFSNHIGRLQERQIGL